jgi:hypothetical protein
MLRLRREGDSPRPAQRQAETCEHCEVGVKLDPLQAAHPERCKAVVVLQAPELTLYGNSVTVEVAEPLAATRDEGSNPATVRGNHRDETLHVLGGSKGDHGSALALCAGFVHRGMVEAPVHRAGLGAETAGVNRIEKARDVERLLSPPCLDVPRKRKPGAAANRRVKFVPVERTCGPSRDSRTVTPRGIGVGKVNALWATPANVLLSIGEGDQVGSVNAYVLAHARKLRMKGGGYTVKASRQERLVGAELDREAVASPEAWRIAQDSLQARMFRDQGGYPRPGWECKESFDKASADECAGSKPLAPSGIARRVNLIDQRGYFGGVEEFSNVPDRRATRYLASCHRSYPFGGHAPGSANCAGALLFGFAGQILFGASDVADARCGEL